MTSEIRASQFDAISPTTSWTQYCELFIRLIVVFILMYMSALSTFALSIDDETAAMRTGDSAYVWLAQGRWGLYLIEKYLVTRPVIVSFPLMVYGLCSTAGYIMLMRSFRIPMFDVRNYALFAVFCAFPTIFFITNFMSNIVGLGIGIVMCCAAALLFDKCVAQCETGTGTWAVYLTSLIVQIALVGAAAGAYQSLLLFALALYVGITIRTFNCNCTLSVAWIARWQAIAVVCIAVSAACSLTVNIVLSASTQLSSSYLSGYFRPDVFFESPKAVLGLMFEQYSQIYGGSSLVYAFSYVTIPLLMLIGYASAIFDTHQRTLLRRAFLILCLVLITFTPFALHLVAGGRMPYRTLVAVPFVVWFFAALANFSRNRWLRGSGITVTVILALQCMYTLALLQTNKRLAYRHDNEIASQIYDRIAQVVPAFSQSKIYKIDFYGGIPYTGPYQDVEQSTYSGSFFNWNGGNSERIRLFFQVTGHSNLISPDSLQRSALMSYWASMAVWPQPNSIRYVDDVILVRIGEQPGLTHSTIAP